MYDIDIKELVSFLREHKKRKKLRNKDIAEKMNIQLTLVEHWFRADRYNAIPSDDVWLELKSVLGIEDNRFDKQIMTYEIREGKHDQTNRVYDIMGIAPTIMTSTPIRVTDGVIVREIATLAMWEFMGVKTEDFSAISGDVGGS